MPSLSVLTYLQRQIGDALQPDDTTSLRYPTSISQLLGIEILAVDDRAATVRMTVSTRTHGNQQGTVHGGTIAELADAAIGTAHSTVIRADESFATIELTVRFLRPVWEATLTAAAWAVHAGRSVSHYRCEIRDDRHRLVATAESSVMTLRGGGAGRSAPRDTDNRNGNDARTDTDG